MQKYQEVLFRTAAVMFIIFALFVTALAVFSFPAYKNVLPVSVVSVWQFMLPVSVMLPAALIFSNMLAGRLGPAEMIPAIVLSAATAVAPVVFKSSEGLDGSFFIGAAVMYFGAFAVGRLLSALCGGFFEKRKTLSLLITLLGLATEAVVSLFLLFCAVRGLLPNIMLTFALLPIDIGMLLIMIPGRIDIIPYALFCSAALIASIFCVVYFILGVYVVLAVMISAFVMLGIKIKQSGRITENH
ncbi:MAG: hypothetical protein IJT91_00270 [Clostridia bacterium]|nr:hypothetical protein [Clostridia bacterium]